MSPRFSMYVYFAGLANFAGASTVMHSLSLFAVQPRSGPIDTSCYILPTLDHVSLLTPSCNCHGNQQSCRSVDGVEI